MDLAEKSAARSSAAETRKFSFHGEGGSLFGIHIVNLFLTIITLGIYHFWGKVKVRKYVWGQVEFEGDRLAYHGTAGEIIRGWLKAVAIFGIPYLLLRMGPQWLGLGLLMTVTGAALATILLLIFIPIAVVGSRRYRLSRTSWRSIRFSFTGRPAEYA